MLVYLAGPITARDGFTVEQNVEAAVTIYFRLIKAGVNAFSPHLSALTPLAFEISYERWLDYDFAIIDACTHVFMLPRWENSPGACREHEYALMKGKPIFYQLADFGLGDIPEVNR